VLDMIVGCNVCLTVNVSTVLRGKISHFSTYEMQLPFKVMCLSFAG
jgi:hypothetical protein